jgi:tetratricopeptide (TPR) repeat protein/tRNA A-37 threonylcarbamoyl transferase component Bud32
MSESAFPTLSSLTPDQALLVEKLCTRFEDAWKKGERPRVEDFLGDVGDDLRPVLLRELILLDMDYRRRLGENPRPEDYWFPGIDAPTPDAEATLPFPKGHTPADAGVPARVGRYTVFELLGKGGMGAVLRALDPDFGRSLALKVLLAEHQDNPELVRRFLEEAQISGRLAHPGIVPVHELGSLPDRRPFFTMKLVKGQTLAELLRQRANPQDDLPRFLTVFEQVCQTLAYAHAAGVIHRDLKPANVMVGAFGEVQVMDWGFAKVLAEDGEAPAPDTLAEVSAIESPREQTEVASRPGTVLGTFAYMAPEQARGEIDKVDKRADVFGLGAVLCVILTGQPPYTANTEKALRGQAEEGDLAGAHARLDGCGADAELVRLCKQCLAAAREERPLDAGAVAEQVTAYRAAVQERLRQAELANAAEVARAEEAVATAAQERKAREAAQAWAAAERRARRRSVAAVALLSLCLLVTSAGGMWLQRYYTDTRQGVESMLTTAKGLRDGARWAEAEEILEQAETRLVVIGQDDLRGRVTQAKGDLKLAKRLDDIRQQRATIVDGKFDDWTADQNYEVAFREAGLGEVGEDVAPVAARIRASAIQAQLVAALDDWAVARAYGTGNPEQSAWMLAVAREADPDDWRDRFRNPKVWKDPAALQALAREAQAKGTESSPQLLAVLGALLIENKGDAVSLLGPAQRRYPKDLWLNFNLGNALAVANKPEEAVGYYRAAQVIRPESGAIHVNLAYAYLIWGRCDEAVAACHQALDVEPTLATAHMALGTVLVRKGALDEAVAAYRKALEYRPDYAECYCNLGDALERKGKLDEAAVACRKALKLRPNFALAHSNLGNVLCRKGEHDAALNACRTAVRLQPDSAVTQTSLGNSLMATNDLDGAAAAFEEAIRLNPDHGAAHGNLGIVLLKRGAREKAAAAFRRAITAFGKAGGPPEDLAIAYTNLASVLKEPDEQTAAYRKAIEIKSDFAAAYFGLALVLGEQGKRDEAIACVKKAVRLDRANAKAYKHLGGVWLVKNSPEDAIIYFQEALSVEGGDADVLFAIGLAYQQKGDLNKAIDSYRKAAEIRERDDKILTALGLALLLSGNPKDAIPPLEKSLKVKPGTSLVLNSLGHAYLATGDVPKAKAKFEEALRIDSKDKSANASLGIIHSAQGDLDGAVGFCRKAIALGHKDPLTYHTLAKALFKKIVLGKVMEQGKALEEVIGALHKALDLDRNNPQVHFDLGMALTMKEALDDALEEFKKAVDLEPNYAEAHLFASQTLLNKGRFADALPMLRKAHKIGSGRPGWPYPSGEWLSQCERFIKLEKRLADVLKGDDSPADAAECADFARICRLKGLPAASAGLYKRAFKDDPRLERDASGKHRFYAAEAAAMAGGGGGKDDPSPDEIARARWRKQALDWLRADLTPLAKQVVGGNPLERARAIMKLQQWRRNPHLAVVRDTDALEKLPEAERDAWGKLWADVAELLTKAGDVK